MTAEIEIKESPVPHQVMSGVRDTLKVIGTALASKGVYDGDPIIITVGVVMLIGPIIWSQIVTRLNKKLTVALAHSAPNAKVVK